MRSSFGAKRKARKVGQDEEDEGGDVRMSGGVDDGEETTPIVRKPASLSRNSSKAKRKPIRTSLGPSMTEDDDENGSTGVFTPKKSNLARQALEKNALRKSLAASIQSEQFPLRQPEDRPSYTADALNELKSSTPSTPKELRSQSDLETPNQSKELDLAAKFGSNLAFTHDSAIPTDAEIREKKERRARLAKEHNYITLNSDGEEQQQQPAADSDDSNDERSSLLPYTQAKPTKYEETRLVPDDEDIAEGFDNFVEDGRIALGRKAEKAQKKRQEAEMRELIEQAEGSDDSSEDDSEVERKAAYEAAQTRAGMDGLRKGEQGAKARRPRTPPKITPLPSLKGCEERLRGELERKQVRREAKVRRLEEVRGELADIAVRKVEVQRLLNEAGERYRVLRGKAEGDGGAKEEVEEEKNVDGDLDEDESGGFGGGSRGGLGSGLGNESTTQQMMMAQMGGGQSMGMGMAANRGLEGWDDT